MENAAEKMIIALLQEIKQEQHNLNRRLDAMDETLELIAGKLTIHTQAEAELAGHTMDFEDLQQLWNTVLLHVQKEISPPSFAAWIQSTNVLAYDESSATITIDAPNAFARDWLEGNYTQLLQETIKRLTAKEITIQFSVQKELNKSS